MITYSPIIQELRAFPNYKLDVLRLDLLHPEISGNKWFKLKRNIEKAIQQDKKTVITFGGSFSNHIAATAACCKSEGLNSIGIIRGEEAGTLNSTLIKAKQNGMRLRFMSRDIYSQKNEPGFDEYLQKEFGDHYLIPEGGNNAEGLLGCMEIINANWGYDYIFCACGTGTTYSGILVSANESRK